MNPPFFSPQAQRRLRGLGGILGFCLLWEGLPLVGAVDPYYLPPPSTVVASLIPEFSKPLIWKSFTNTLQTWITGLAIAMVLGGIAGLLIGSFRSLRELTASTIEFLRPIPSVALIPLVVLLLGTGRTATLTLVIYASFWQVLVQISYGVQDVDPVAKGTGTVYRFSRWSMIRHVVWPTALPYALTGFRLAAAVALMLTITGELLIGTPGLGRMVVEAQSAGDFPKMYGMIAIAGVLGVVVNLLTRQLEARVLAWHPSLRSEAL